jgi:hypothetical protein
MPGQKSIYETFLGRTGIVYIQVRVYVYKCTVRVPCKVIFRIGFMPNYDSGSEQW